MTNETTEAARNRFAELSESYWRGWRQQTKEQTHSLVRQIDGMVAEWTEQGTAIDILLPLLKYQSAAVRLAAATYLVKSKARGEAMVALQELAKDPDGPIAPMAAAIFAKQSLLS